MADRVLLPADLFESAERVFQGKKFDAVRTHVGIVATRWKFETPMMFKTAVDQAHGDRGNFIPASAAPSATRSRPPARLSVLLPVEDRHQRRPAYPSRRRGYSANNPILYAAGHHL